MGRNPISCFSVRFSLICTPNTPGTILEITGPVRFFVFLFVFFFAPRTKIAGLGREVVHVSQSFKDSTHF